jgi:hypothetical protein
MMNYLIPALALSLAIVYISPLKDLTSMIIQCTILGALVIGVSWYGIIGFKEKINDEREEKIRAVSHRISYLFGMSGLALIMLYHLLTLGHVYPETIILLASMSAVKLAVHWYGERNW